MQGSRVADCRCRSGFSSGWIFLTICWLANPVQATDEWLEILPEMEQAGLEAWQMEPEHWRFFDRSRQADLVMGDAVVRINGIKVHLDRSPREGAGGPELLRADWESTLQPLLALEPAVDPVDLVWIDAGHGGKDSGAVNSREGLLEKAIALDVALGVSRRLSAAGFRVGLSRADDRYVALGQRVEMANRAGADLFVSIHLNAFEDPSVSGVEVFVLAPPGLASTGEARRSETDDVLQESALPGNRFDRKSALLGYRLQRALVTETGDVDRGLKRARFAVLKGLECPGALVELGFLSEPSTASRLKEPGSVERFAETLAAAIVEYCRLGGTAENPS